MQNNKNYSTSSGDAKQQKLYIRDIRGEEKEHSTLH
jgi:hypothetical protein